MKKLLGILVLGLLLMPTQVKAGPIGSGEIKLKPQAVNSFIQYIQMRDKPHLFLIPIDGSSAYSWKCPAGVQCVAGGYTQELAYCERHFKKECKVFAKRRTIKWQNGINKGNKESRFKSKMTAAEIKTKLTSLGFLGGTTSTTTKVEKKETKTTETTSSKTLYVATAKNKKDDQVVIQRKSKSMQDAKDAALKGCRLYFEPYGKSMQDACYIDDISEKKKAEKKKEPKKKMSEDVVQQLKDLNELYKSGALTKEEYTKAKKKLLN